MKTLILGDNVSATAVAAQSAVQPLATPFLAGRDVIGRIVMNGVTGTPTVKIQGSDDNSTWVDLMTNTTLVDKAANIKLRPYMRLNVTVVGGAGTVSAYCDNGT